MTLLSPIDDSHGYLASEAGSPTLSAQQADYLRDLGADGLPPLRVTTHASVPAAESTPLRLRDETAVRDAVGRFAAATLLPATASDETRERVRGNWAGAVTVVEVATHPEWMLAFIPGSHVGDALVHAVHLTTGHVFGGDTGPTIQQAGESTQHWLDRLTADFETHAADYSLAYVAYRDHA